MKQESLSRLEPCAGKLASTVLRGDWLPQGTDSTRRGEQSCKSTLVMNQIARAISTSIPHILYFDYEGCFTLDTQIRVHNQYVPFASLLPMDWELPVTPQFLDITVPVDTLGSCVDARLYYGGVREITRIHTATTQFSGSQHPVLVVAPDGTGSWKYMEELQVGDTILVDGQFNVSGDVSNAGSH